MNVVVLGAAGRTGRLLVGLLGATGQDVVGVVRRPEQVPDVEAVGASARLLDLESGDLGSVIGEGDVVVWAVGASRADPPGHPARIRDAALRAVTASEHAGAGRWIQVSTMYADRPDESPPVMQESMRLKGDVDDALRRSGLRWTIVRPGGLGDGPLLGGVSIADHLPPGMIMRADVAAVVTELVRTGVGIGAAFDLVAGDVPIVEAVASLSRSGDA
jgi:uncharacterized protein YbjT (DUF2867 family)